ncbi:unnamed protein product [Effrenium voratum]|nr:unnamed protein product [Effrenium voratum]
MRLALVCLLALCHAAKIRVDREVARHGGEAQSTCGALANGQISAFVNDFTSKSKMEANGWSFANWEATNGWKPDAYSANVPPGSYWGSKPGDAALELQLTLKGRGTALVTFGNQCCGTTKVKLNGAELATAYAEEFSQFIEVHFEDGDVLTIGEYDTSVMIIEQVFFLCDAHVAKFSHDDCEGNDVNDFSSYGRMFLSGWRFKNRQRKNSWKPRNYRSGVPGGSYWGFRGGNAALELSLTLRGTGYYWLAFGNQYKRGVVKFFVNDEEKSSAGAATYKEIAGRFVDGYTLTIGEYNTAVLVVQRLWISCDQRHEARCGARTRSGGITNNVNNFASKGAMLTAGWTFKNWQRNSFRHKNYKQGVPPGSYWGFRGGSTAQEMSLTLKGSGRLAMWYGNQNNNGAVKVIIDGQEKDSIVKGASPERSRYLELSFKDGDILKIGEYQTSVIILTKVIFECAPRVAATGSQCSNETKLSDFGSQATMEENGWVFNQAPSKFKPQEYSAGVPPGSFWAFVDGAPALEVSTTLHGTGSVVVNPILESLVTEVLLERPENPVPFMVRWLAERSKTGKDSLYSLGVGEAEKLRNEIRELQGEIKVLSDKVGEAKSKDQEKKDEPEAKADAPAAKEEAAKAEEEEEKEEKEEEEKEEKKNDSEEEESDFGSGEEDDADDDWKPPAAYMKKGQRGSVSAEAYGAFNEKKAFEPPVYEKSGEQEGRINEVLSKSFLFNALSKDDLKVILGAFLEKKIPSGDRIIQEGDDGDVMFLIESGAFDCLKKIDGAEKVVKKCGPGDVFGELALLYNCPRAASVQATEESTVWQLDRETFTHIVRDASAKRREAFMDFLKTVPLFKPLESYDLMQLADCLQQQTLEAGQKILKQGEPGDTFYIVEEGQLTATKKRDDGKEEEVLEYQRGDFFGELALLRNEPRAASVEAKTEAKICKIDRKSFKNILGQLEAQFKEAAAKYKP